MNTTAQLVTVDAMVKKCHGLAYQQPSAHRNVGEGSETREVAVVVTCPICGRQLRAFNAKHLDVHGITMAQFLAKYPSWHQDNSAFYAEASVRCKAAAAKFWAPENGKEHEARDSKLKRAWLSRSEEDRTKHAETGRRNALRGWDVDDAAYERRVENIRTGTMAATTSQQRRRNTRAAALKLHASMTEIEREQFVAVRRDWWHNLPAEDYQRICQERKDRWNENRETYCRALRERWRNMSTERRDELAQICARNAHVAIRRKGRTEIEKRCVAAIVARGLDVVTQFRVGRYLSDVFVPAYNLVIETYGDFWHGHPRLFDLHDVHPVRNKTVEAVYRHDARKEEAILSVHNLAVIWESDVTNTAVATILDRFAATSSPKGVYCTSMDKTYQLIDFQLEHGAPAIAGEDIVHSDMKVSGDA